MACEEAWRSGVYSMASMSNRTDIIMAINRKSDKPMRMLSDLTMRVELPWSLNK